MGWTSSYCRVCFNSCGILVRAEDGVALEVKGDPAHPLSSGYTCGKGRSQAELLNDPGRLRHSMKRRPDGSFEAIGVEQALDEIAAKLGRLLSDWGPASIASYYGTMATTNSATGPVLGAFMDAIGSPMRFSPNTIDKPGKMVAEALHGSWLAPSEEYDEPEVALLVGLNPLIAYQGVPRGNPAAWIRDRIRQGMRLVVVDPRRTETARLATRHLQPPPGCDVEILACLLHVIFEDGLVDEAFVAEHAHGATELRAAVARFTPYRVAGATGLRPDDLVATAHDYATRRGYIALGTGPNMSGPGVLLEYLALCLETVCGHRLREGDVVRNAPMLLPPRQYRAEATSPVPAFGLEPRLSGSGLARSRAGLPIAGIPDQIAVRDEGSRFRALISCGGNPASAWPDQRRVVDGLRRLELLVQIDPWMSDTARLADYVLAPSLPLEVAGSTQVPLDNMTMLGNGYGLARSFAQWTDAVADRPRGSDLVDDWEIYWGLAERLGLSLVLTQQSVAPIRPIAILPGPKPTTVELLTWLAEGSRVPLSDVRDHEHGLEPPADVVVGRPAEGSAGRLALANPDMMADLGAIRMYPPDGDLRLTCRRIQQVYNSSHHHPSTLRGRRYNPAHLHPDDIERLGLVDGDEVEVRSSRAAVVALVRADPDLRPGVVSMTHCFGGLPDDEAIAEEGANTALLVDLDDLQPYTGQPVMSNIRVEVRRRTLAPGRPRVLISDINVDAAGATDDSLRGNG